MEIGRAAALFSHAGLKLAGLAANLAAAAAAIFVAIELLPGDPAATVLGLNATPEALAALRAEYGFDQPVIWRFFTWLGGFVSGDLGQSYTYRVPVLGLIEERAAVSVPLAVLAMGLSVLIGLSLALLAAWRRRWSFLVTLFGEIGLAVPNFWLGLLLILLFSVSLGLFPSGGFPGWDKGWAAWRALILPSVALALPQAAIIARLALTLLRETLTEPYIRTAKAKGMAGSAILFRHALPNALVPLLAIMGLQFSFLLGGSIIIENVFALPGLGRLMAQAIAGHDIIVVRDLILLFASAILIVHALTGMLQGFIDPRLKERAEP